MIGPGKYDEMCTIVRLLTGAEGVVLVVLNGNRGCGVSMQAPPGMQTAVMSDLLRSVCDQIEQSAEGKHT